MACIPDPGANASGDALRVEHGGDHQQHATDQTFPPAEAADHFAHSVKRHACGGGDSRGDGAADTGDSAEIGNGQSLNAAPDNREKRNCDASAGKGIRINENDVRAMGRTAAGVRGIKIKQGDEVISLIAVDSNEGQILFATENGYGKRTLIDDFSVQGRGGQGVISIKTSTRNGRVIGVIKTEDDGEIMLISNGGTLVRTPASDISVLGRNTQGVTLIRLSKGEQLVQIEPVAGSDDDDEDEESDA